MTNKACTAVNTKQGVFTAVSAKTTSWVTIIVGAVVSAIGQYLRPGELGAGILGFGLAHIVLGAIDMLRPTVRQES